MATRPVAWYEAKIVFGLSTLLPLLALPAQAIILALANRPDRPIAPEYIRKTYDVLLPPVVALAAAHLMSIEREERFDELRRSYPESIWALPLLRTGGAVLLSAFALALSALCLRLGYGPYNFMEVIAPSAAPGLYMLGVALVANNLTGSYWAAAGVVVGSWVFDVLTRGRYTGILFLFEAAWPRGQFPLTWNRALLLALGAILLLLNIALSAHSRAPRRAYAR